MSKPRIIAGTAKGRYLETPTRGTRPSPSRLREALFNILQSREQGTFLDLFGGSGAVGLEAASRGWDVTLIDLSKEASTIIRQNAKTLKLAVNVVQGDALAFVANPPSSYDLVFASPPYTLELPPIYQKIYDSGVASELLIFQHPTTLSLGFSQSQTRVYGSNALTFIEAK